MRRLYLLQKMPFTNKHNIMSYDLTVSSSIDFDGNPIVCLQNWDIAKAVRYNQSLALRKYFLFTMYNSVAIAVPGEQYNIVSMGHDEKESFCWVSVIDKDSREQFTVFNSQVPKVNIKSLRLDIDEMSKGLPVVLCGSFDVSNIREIESDSVGAVEFEKKLVNTIEYGNDDYTTHGVLKSGEKFRDITDFIFVSDFHVINSMICKPIDYVPARKNSTEHFPVKATIALAERRKCFATQYRGKSHYVDREVVISNTRPTDLGYSYVTIEFEISFKDGFSLKVLDFSNNTLVSIPCKTEKEADVLVSKIEKGEKIPGVELSRKSSHFCIVMNGGDVVKSMEIKLRIYRRLNRADSFNSDSFNSDSD